MKHQLALKVQGVGKEVEQVLKVLQGEGQAIWTVARSSTLMKLDYHLALCYPTDMVEAAIEMDRLLRTILECSSTLSIPKVDEGRGVECCLQTPVTRHQVSDTSYRTPVTRHQLSDTSYQTSGKILPGPHDQASCEVGWDGTEVHD